MIRSKKTAMAVTPVVTEPTATEQSTTAVAEATAEQPRAASVPMKAEGLIVHGRLIYLDVPGCEGLKVGIRVDNPWGIVKGPGVEDGYDGWLVKLAAIAPRWQGWTKVIDPVTRQEIQQPDPLDLTTYLPFVEPDGALHEIGLWIIKEGLNLALEESLGPNSGRG